MILLLEVYLTYKAWVRGWKGWALVPWAIVWVLAVASSAGERLELGVLLMFELLLVGILAVMAINGHHTVPDEPHSKTAGADCSVDT